MVGSGKCDTARGRIPKKDEEGHPADPPRTTTGEGCNSQIGEILEGPDLQCSFFGTFVFHFGFGDYLD